MNNDENFRSDVTGEIAVQKTAREFLTSTIIDHETRIRALEVNRWRMAGMSGIISGVLSALVAIAAILLSKV
jgi:hypothetical protein